VGKVGRKPDYIRCAWAERLNLTLSRNRNKVLSTKLLLQLSLCRSDEARRLIAPTSELEGK
jgi:hypothetical protein